MGLDAPPNTIDQFGLEQVVGYLTTESGDRLLTESGDLIYVTSYSPPATTMTPRVMLRWSDDGGHTWSNEHWRSMGRIGQTGHRVIWRRLGMTQKIRDRVYEISGTDPVSVTIMGAELIASPTSA